METIQRYRTSEWVKSQLQENEENKYAANERRQFLPHLVKRINSVKIERGSDYGFKDGNGNTGQLRLNSAVSQTCDAVDGKQQRLTSLLKQKVTVGDGKKICPLASEIVHAPLQEKRLISAKWNQKSLMIANRNYRALYSSNQNLEKVIEEGKELKTSELQREGTPVTVKTTTIEKLNRAYSEPMLTTKRKSRALTPHPKIKVGSKLGQHLPELSQLSGLNTDMGDFAQGRCVKKELFTRRHTACGERLRGALNKEEIFIVN